MSRAVVSPELSLVIPILNEEEGLSRLCQRLAEVVASLKMTAEFLFVDDGSTDRSVEVLRRLQREDRRIRVVVLSRNFGKEAALSCGLDHALGRAVVPMDADLQDPPELLHDMVRLWREGYEVVNAQREDRSSDSALKRFTARAFYWAINKVSDVPLPSNVGDYRLLDRKVVDALKLLPERRRFMKGLFAWIGFRTATVTYTRPAREAGSSTFNYWKLWNLALEGVTSFSTAPLRMWTYAGVGICAIAFLYGGYIFFRTLIFGVDVPGYTSLFLAILFFGGVQMVGMGLMGEYIGRIFLEAKQRPVYVVRDRF